MARIMIVCPSTGKYISAGIAMDRMSFESCEMSGNQVGCPECGEVHTWDKKDAHWIDEIAVR